MDHISLYISNKATLSRSRDDNTIKNYERVLRNLKFDPTNCKNTDPEEWIHKMEKKGLRMSSIKTNFSVLRDYVKYLYLRDIVPEKLYKVVQAARFPTTHSEERIPLTSNEVEEIIKRLKRLSHKALVCYILDTGFRISSALRTKKEHLHIKKDEWYKGEIPYVHLTDVGDTTKSEKGVKPLSMRTVEYLRRYLRRVRGTKVFNMSRQTINQPLKRAAKDAGIKKKVFVHLLRHTATTILKEKGLKDKYLQKFGDWASKEMMDHYGHEDDFKLMEKIYKVRKNALSR